MTCILHQTAQMHSFLSFLSVLCPLDYQANAIYLELERMGESFESNCCTMCRHHSLLTCLPLACLQAFRRG